MMHYDLVPPIQMSLEKAIEFIQDDELVEVTPKNIRSKKENIRFIKKEKEQLEIVQNKEAGDQFWSPV